MTRPVVAARAALALAALLALVLLTPVLLASFGNPVLDVVDVFGDDLASDSSRSEALLTGALVVIGWMAWAMITLAVANESLAAMQGRLAPRLPLLPGVQTIARSLVTSVTLAGTVLTTSHAAATPLPAATDLSVLVDEMDVPATPAQAHDAAEPADTAPPTGPTYRVERSDTWWSMADQLLGSGSRWRELIDANEGRTMPDGTVISGATHRPRAGWILTLPAEAVLPLKTDNTTERPSAPDAEQYEVLAGDTLWDLAVERLPPGTPTDQIVRAVIELFDANDERIQHDGRTLTDPNVLEPGWTLTIPNLAVDPANEPRSSPPRSVVVQRGDTLWDLAETHLGDGERFDELVEQNQGVPQPDGRSLQDPDIIESGWELELPSAVAEAPSAPNTGNTPAPEDTTAASETPPTTEANDSPAPAPEERVVGPAAPAPTTPTPVPPTSAEPAGPADQPDNGDSVPAGLIVAGIATAGVVLMLDRRRRAQRQRRRPGHVMPELPLEVEQAECVLRAGASVPTAERVAIALQAAAAGLSDETFPSVRYVSVTDDVVKVHLDEELAAPAGFETHGRTWVTTDDHQDLEILAYGGIDPLPLLCPIGTATDGDEEILVDLDSAGVLAITGPEERTTGLMRSITLSVSTAIWATSPRVIAVGMTGEVAALDWVTTTSTLVEGLEAVCRNLQSRPLHLSSGAALDPGDPVVVVSSTTSWAVHERQLHEIADGAPCGSAVVLPGPASDGAGIVARVDGSGLIDYPGVDVEVVASRLSDDDLRVVQDLLQRAAAPADDVPAEDGLPPTGVRCLPTLTEELQDYDVLVRIMGDVTVERLGDGRDAQSIAFERTRSQEAVVYLSAREEGRGVALDDLRAALWPDGRAVDQTVRNTISRARSGLGHDADGTPYLPAPTDGRYHLSRRVVTDFEVFWSMCQMADELDDPVVADQMLDQALQLVRGEPFLGTGRSYAWTSSIGTTILVAVVDVADELGQSRLERDDPRGAERAARAGLTIAPGEERLYRLLMRAAAALDSKPMIERLYREMLDVLADPDFGIEPEATVSDETVALFNELMGRRDRRTA